MAWPHRLCGHPLTGSQLWSLWPMARGELRKLWVALQDGSKGVCLAPGSFGARDKGCAGPGRLPTKGTGRGARGEPRSPLPWPSVTGCRQTLGL